MRSVVGSCTPWQKPAKTCGRQPLPRFLPASRTALTVARCGLAASTAELTGPKASSRSTAACTCRSSRAAGCGGAVSSRWAVGCGALPRGLQTAWRGGMLPWCCGCRWPSRNTPCPALHSPRPTLCTSAPGAAMTAALASPTRACAGGWGAGRHAVGDKPCKAGSKAGSKAGREQGGGHKRGAKLPHPCALPPRSSWASPPAHQHLVGCVARRAHQPLLLHVLHRALHLRGEASRARVGGQVGWRGGGCESRSGDSKRVDAASHVWCRTFCRYASRACL